MSEIVPFNDDQDDTSNYLDRVFRGLAEGLTGIAASEKKELFRSLGYLLQRIRSGRFLKTLNNEWERFREKGKIRDDYTHTEQHGDCLQEILDFLDEDSPDETRFTFMKKLFLAIATENLSDRSSVLPQQYLRICRRLSSGEVLVLLTTYRIAEKGNFQRKRSEKVKEWLQRIAEESGLKHPELAEIHERSLVEKNLLTSRGIADPRLISTGSHYRLTDLALEICQFVALYDRDDEA